MNAEHFIIAQQLLADPAGTAATAHCRERNN
jgi:hypothetical protein